jgi:hypothetical protein
MEGIAAYTLWWNYFPSLIVNDLEKENASGKKNTFLPLALHITESQLKCIDELLN